MRNCFIWLRSTNQLVTQDPNFGKAVIRKIKFWSSFSYVRTYRRKGKIKGINTYLLTPWSIDFKKAYDSVRRQVLYNILMEFGVLKGINTYYMKCVVY